MTYAAYLARVATVPFRLGRPEDLPSDPADIMRWGQHRARCVIASIADSQARTDLPALLAAIGDVRAALGDQAGEPVGVDPAESEANRDNDLGFGIERIAGPPLPLLIDAAVAALGGILELAIERGVGLDAQAWRQLVHGVDSLLDWCADTRHTPRPRPVPLPVERGKPRDEDALRRWVRGHHLFMVLAQGCVMATACLRHHAELKQVQGAVAAASMATKLMLASRAALQYAGDVAQHEYSAEIRPTLMPPVAPPKMSGLHWRDHEALVRELSRSTSAWQWLAGRHPACLAEFRDALGATYQAHRGVCEHFVGNESPSLLASAGSSRSAVSVLTQFRKIRLDTLPPAPDHDGGDR
jgi:hypothetical protein